MTHKCTILYREIQEKITEYLPELETTLFIYAECAKYAMRSVNE